MHRQLALAALSIGFGITSLAQADQVFFTNGDVLTGKIKSVDAGKMVVTSEVAGDIIIEMAKVKTFTTDAPVEFELTDKTVIKANAAQGESGNVRVAAAGEAPERQVAFTSIKRINPPPVKWTGSVVANALVTRGNSNTENAGLTFDAQRRAEVDRMTLQAGLLYGRQEDPATEDQVTTQDNWFAFGKYDYFVTPKFYLYGSTRVERDRIAELDYRITPSLGAGYQWVERPDLNFLTEAGVSWVYEKYENTDDAENHFAARLAYRLDKVINPKVRLFHSLEYLPNVEEPEDFNLNADLGIRATLTARMFTEFKLELRYDDSPAPGSEHTDLRYILGVGWQF